MENSSKNYPDTRRKKKTKQERKIALMVILLFALLILGLVLPFYNKKTADGKFIKNIEYAYGAVLDKSLDLRTGQHSLVYINAEKKVFAIHDSSLWTKAEKGDSIRIGFQESGGEGIFSKYRLCFKSVQVLGKAKGIYDIRVYSSPEPPKNEDSNIVYIIQ